jgi:ABC-type bacteriocin/lantibiotic exporter with double-glycine peptidase domain
LNIIKNTTRYILKYKLLVTLFFISSAVIWLTNIFVPLVSGKYIDLLIRVQKINIIYEFSVILIIFYIVKITMNFTCKIVRTKLETMAVFDLRYDAIEHVKKLPLLYFKNYNSAYQNQQISEDCNTTIRFVISNLSDLIINLVTFFFSLSILIKISARVALFLFILIPIYAFIYLAFKKPLFQSKYQIKESRNRFFGKINEQLANIKHIKYNSTYEVLGVELKHDYKEVLKSVMKGSRILFLFQSCDMSILGLSEIILFFFGGIEVINNNITIGEFTIINNYFIMLINCVSYYLNLGESYQDALSSYNRLRKITDMAQEQNGSININHINEIRLEDLTFSYDGNNNIIYKLNYKFERGKIYCVCGSNGSGKSTLIGLLLGIYNGYYNGNIYYNNVNISDIDLYSIRRDKVGVVEQEPIVIDDSIINNIVYGVMNKKEFINKNMPNIIDLCKVLDFYDYINSLPDGFNTKISSGLLNTSGGEKQKLSIIRSLSKNPEFLVLDEPTSALDKETSISFMNLIQEYKNDRIIIIITHDKSIAEVADEIISMN